MVVPVLITSCQVSDQLEQRPGHRPDDDTLSARMKAGGRPVADAIRLATISKDRSIGIPSAAGRMRPARRRRNRRRRSDC